MVPAGMRIGLIPDRACEVLSQAMDLSAVAVNEDWAGRELVLVVRDPAGHVASPAALTDRDWRDSPLAGQGRQLPNSVYFCTVPNSQSSTTLVRGTKKGIRDKMNRQPGKQRRSGPQVSEKEDTRDVYRIRDTLGGRPETWGLREQNKVDKLQRIYMAARRQFTDAGYDATTLRDIAKEARVALGTLGFYAENKRELVLLIFNEAMPPILERCRKTGVYQGSLADALVKFFRPAYAAYAAEPELFRTILRENVFHTTSPHAREFHRIRAETIGYLRDLASQARNEGEIKPHIDVDLMARAVFYLFFSAVRWWICTDRPSVEPGLAEVRSMIALLLEGMKNDRAEQATSARRRTARGRR